MSKPQDPCQKEACSLQTCLKRNNFQEDKCEETEMADLINCCRKYKERSALCVGMRNRWDIDLIKSPPTAPSFPSRAGDVHGKDTPSPVQVAVAAQDVAGIRCWDKVDRIVMSFA